MENNSSAGGHRESRQHEGCRHPDKALERSEVNIEGFTTNKKSLNKCETTPLRKYRRYYLLIYRKKYMFVVRTL